MEHLHLSFCFYVWCFLFRIYIYFLLCYVTVFKKFVAIFHNALSVYKVRKKSVIPKERRKKIICNIVIVSIFRKWNSTVNLYLRVYFVIMNRWIIWYFRNIQNYWKVQFLDERLKQLTTTLVMIDGSIDSQLINWTEWHIHVCLVEIYWFQLRNYHFRIII